MKELTNRQVCLMMCISVVSLKFLFFPAIVSLFARNDAYISVLLGLIIDFAVVVIIVYSIKRFNKSFKDIIIDNLGKVAFYVVYSILFLYLMFKALLAVKEVHHYFLEFLYEDFGWLWFAIPMIMLLGYITSKNLRAIGRTVEILFLFIAFGVVVTILIPIKDINFDYLLPVFTRPQGILEGVFRTSFIYADWIILLITMGNVKLHKNSLKKVLLIVAGVYIFVVIFMVEYVGLFKNIGIYKPYAFSDMPLYADLPNNSARIDWFSSIIWTFDLILQACMMVSLASHTLRDLFPKISPAICSLVCMALLVAGMLTFYLNLSKLISFITSTWFCGVAFAFHMMLALLLVVCILVDTVKNRVSKGIKHVKKVA